MFKRRLTYLLVTLSVATSFQAQDYHVSHYDVASLYLNPALTGIYGRERGDYRVYFDQRSQWRSIGIKPFMTTYLAYDQPFKQWGKSFGLGGFIINNNGGIGNFNTITMMASASYDILNSSKGNAIVIDSKKNSDHLLSVGLQMGLFYRSTNPTALNYDVQYSIANNGGTFDQSIPNNEAYNRINIARFDANYGLHYRYIARGKKARPFANFSMAHLTRPNESLTGGLSRLPIRWVGQAGCDIEIDDKMDITPRLLYMNQIKASEISGGFLFYYRINDNHTKVVAGFDYRWKDACVVNLGLKHDSYTIRLSYDINTSYLKNYSRGRGAFEISLVYIGEKGVPFFKSVSQF